MALTNRQIQGVCRMFAIAFVYTENEKDRKKIIIDFEDAFSAGIANWKELCGEQIKKLTEDTVVIEEYISLSTRNEEDKKIKCDIRPICKEDFEQVREIINSAFDMSITKSDEGEFDYFVKNGFSFVACKDDEILGVILAYVEPDLSVPAVYVNSFAVAGNSRGKGIGKALFTHLKIHAREKNMFLIKLQTEPNIEAFEIYKHWGMRESEMVQMKGYCF